jgi:hypothetical protein
MPDIAAKFRCHSAAEPPKFRCRTAHPNRIQVAEPKAFIGTVGRLLDPKTQNSAMLAEMGGVSF